MRITSAVLTFVLHLGLVILSYGQVNEKQPSAPAWTETDRQYLLDNLIRSKEALFAETKGLTDEQWNFKESPDAWSINQIVEHLALYELIFVNDIAVALQMGPLPEFTHYAPDSLFTDQDSLDLRQNKTTDFTKPFSYTVPLGNNKGTNNLIWVTKMRQETIDFVRTEDRNLRTYYVNFGPNVHQRCMMIFSHSDRHLRQIKRVKTHPTYPS
jgi:hypothetical protein